ncbi:hypothetical protein [Sanguibacter antarcticus]|uniref:Uncharacterized protein n=1 Tax=Sanguibacter antarcticus TaxID=372484 RepID=A0A2A9E751_9MICO|nr:hypothetical protein [Sanguibacter antarcticus]PFG34887.1 hypothetical protein ATL42_2818 [Sanguibacter antarcticus]
MSTGLTILSGLAWTIVYIEAIRLGFKHRTYAMPVAALGLNIAWETIYAAVEISNGGSIQGVSNLVWALADVAIVYTFFRFGRSELPMLVPRWLFVTWGAGILVVGYVVQWLFIVEFGLYLAPRYAAFLQNALMSGLFIAFFVARRGARGQSLTLGVAKWLGTLAPTMLFGVVKGFDPFILGLGLICSVLDLAYIGLLVWARRVPLTISPTVPAGERAAPQG